MRRAETGSRKISRKDAKAGNKNDSKVGILGALGMAGKREFMEEYGVPEENIAIVYNGVDVERFHPRNRARYGNKTRESLGISTTSQMVLFVGTGFRRKGAGRLLQMWTEQGGPFGFDAISRDGSAVTFPPSQSPAF